MRRRKTTVDPGHSARFVARSVEISAAAPRQPHGRPAARLQVGVVAILHLATNGDRGRTPPLAFLKGLDHEPDLGLDHDDHRVVAQSGVGPHEGEQVGIPGDVQTQMGRLDDGARGVLDRRWIRRAMQRDPVEEALLENSYDGLRRGGVEAV